ncbi:glycosyltransferase [Desulfolucanica intricata]|uniref:glycosyltransferase n=1 Tax=Desulfolucanica intricata TaxID=1285191 RepID=UPI000AE93518|nr:glycosyltransferase [Desulfolucanica intricata]
MTRFDIYIMFLIRSLNYGGAERQLVTLARGLHQSGYKVAVAVFYPGGPLEKDLEETKITVIHLNKRHRWDVFGFLWRLVRLLRTEKPEILHGYLGMPNILTVMLKPIFPRMRMVWGVRASDMDLARYDWLSRLAYRIECCLSRFADLIIANSHAGLNYAVRNGFPREKMRVIPNGIDTNRFQPDPDAGARVRNQWGVSGKETLIGLVGRLDPMKDHPTFLKAASILLRNRKNLRFVCIGEGPSEYKQELNDLSRELGLTEHLIWAGVRRDMPAVYSALNIAVSSSYSEGFPNVIGEAMACGIPCVVTNAGDSAKIVGDLGIVIQPQSPQELAEGLRAMLAGLDDIKPDLLRKRIIQNFSLHKLIETTEEVLIGQEVSGNV